MRPPLAHVAPLWLLWALVLALSLALSLALALSPVSPRPARSGRHSSNLCAGRGSPAM